MKRTHLPLNGLRVLDAAARHLSFTRAADELAVTPAAVGQQIRALEDMLGVVMFRRTPKGLELTDEAAAGLDALRSGFLEFEDAVRAMQAGQSSHKLTIAAPRDLTTKWLNERLAAFSADNKDVSFALVASEGGADFTEANLDIAIGLTDGPGENEGVIIGDTMFVKITAPGGGAGQKIDWPGCPISEGEETLMRVADGGLAIEAAANGFGHAWVPKMLVQKDIKAGRVEVIGEDSKSSRGYWLVAPLPQWRQKKVKALVAALTA
ncbi:transcriptional regulator GcvA [Parasphingorhabdus litoris]|uniref:Transcriptional regulator GcvA n=1 Tax=Parasphingorhabdus litoris TaxID=394733 RepID=A0ABN1AN84_9SPHN|nr:LysR family transcriptional regulator [Parasphingorhabdus litoris]